MTTIVSGVVTNGVVVPSSPLPEGTCVEIRLATDVVPNTNPLLNFSGHMDSNDPMEREFRDEPARLRRECLEQTPASITSDQGNTRRISMLEFLKDLPPGPRAFDSWQDYEQHLREEKEAWDR